MLNRMTTYIVIHIDVDNPADLDRYRELALPTMRSHHIQLVAKGPPEVLEGNPGGRMLVVLSAESEAAARAWYGSPEYAEAIEARRGVATFRTELLPAG